MKLALVVDSSKAQCQFLSTFLDREGYRAITANDVAHAIEMHRDCDPDLVLMRINLAFSGEIDADKKLHQLHNKIQSPIIFTSLDSSEEVLIDSIKVGGDDVLVSPFSYDEFSGKIRTLLSKPLSHKNTKPSQQKFIWELQSLLTPERLRTMNPVLMLMRQIDELEGPSRDWRGLHTILTELYVNALDHGVLGLCSDLKSSESGFASYFKKREQLLETLKTGFIDISLKHYKVGSVKKIMIIVKDSGAGFDFLKLTHQLGTSQATNTSYSGRGLQLVSQLCESVKFADDGSRVEATYLCE